MSQLTLELLGSKPTLRRRSVWQARYAAIADRLVAAYGTPSLGNFEDPVREIFYIVLSAKTTDAQYRRTHQRLLERFPTLADLAGAQTSAIARCISRGGLANKKAGQLKRIADCLTADFGVDPDGSLRSLPAREAFDYLVRLPGLGPKSALCVLMCSLNFDVFPVDVNVSRIACRVGMVAAGLKHYDYTRILPAAVPEGRSKELHVGLVVHGRTVCLPRRPRCEHCSIRDLCAYGKRSGRRRNDG